MARYFFLSSLRLTSLEIFSGVGWALILVTLLAAYFGAPLFLPVEDGEDLFARGQMLCAVCWLAGLYSIALGSKFGGLQVSRGLNLFFRAMGKGDVARFAGIVFAATLPVFLCLVTSSLLLLFGHWVWGNGLWDGAVSTLQFNFLFYLPFLASVCLGVGVGALVSGGAGTLVGLGFYLTGAFLPPLLSIGAGTGSVLMEILWALSPHFYSLDWSPAAVYLWKPATLEVFSRSFIYGVFWLLIAFAFGAGFFRLSKSQSE